MLAPDKSRRNGCWSRVPRGRHRSDEAEHACGRRQDLHQADFTGAPDRSGIVAALHRHHGVGDFRRQAVARGLRFGKIAKTSLARALAQCRWYLDRCSRRSSRRPSPAAVPAFDTHANAHVTAMPSLAQPIACYRPSRAGSVCVPPSRPRLSGSPQPAVMREPLIRRAHQLRRELPARILDGKACGEFGVDPAAVDILGRRRRKV